MIPTSKLANRKYTSSNLLASETDKSKLLSASMLILLYLTRATNARGVTKGHRIRACSLTTDERLLAGYISERYLAILSDLNGRMKTEINIM